MEHTRWNVTTTCWSDKSQQLHRLGDKLLQQVVWHVTALHRFVCTGEFLWKSLSQQRNFVTVTSCTNSAWFDFVQLATVTEFCCGDKNSLIHTQPDSTWTLFYFSFCFFFSLRTQRVRMSVEWSINPPVFLFSIMCARQTLKRK